MPPEARHRKGAMQPHRSQVIAALDRLLGRALRTTYIRVSLKYYEKILRFLRKALDNWRNGTDSAENQNVTMRRPTHVLLFVLSVAFGSSPTPARAAGIFSDTLCPNATPSVVGLSALQT